MPSDLTDLSGTDWPSFTALSENEFAALELARAIGISVPLTEREFSALSKPEQGAILKLTAENGAVGCDTFDAELADLYLGLFEAAEPGCVLPSYFLHLGEVDSNLRAKIAVIYRTAIALAKIPSCD